MVATRGNLKVEREEMTENKNKRATQLKQLLFLCSLLKNYKFISTAILAATVKLFGNADGIYI